MFGGWIFWLEPTLELRHHIERGRLHREGLRVRLQPTGDGVDRGGLIGQVVEPCPDEAGYQGRLPRVHRRRKEDPLPTPRCSRRVDQQIAAGAADGLLVDLPQEAVQDSRRPRRLGESLSPATQRQLLRPLGSNERVDRRSGTVGRRERLQEAPHQMSQARHVRANAKRVVEDPIAAGEGPVRSSRRIHCMCSLWGGQMSSETRIELTSRRRPR